MTKNLLVLPVPASPTGVLSIRGMTTEAESVWPEWMIILGIILGALVLILLCYLGAWLYNASMKICQNPQHILSKEYRRKHRQWRRDKTRAARQDIEGGFDIPEPKFPIAVYARDPSTPLPPPVPDADSFPYQFVVVPREYAQWYSGNFGEA
ncbi:hypothetical protein N7466_006355 [Penicillium verhagenii]|uniref:uncharacterized protein n=1 Tax=Penicillium verhagenii TaxID=1562060 RepID=UPI0025450903|nr:uncharacterized protein N7466_006355 [Penicillium verhagenii]KAJ5930862.1 hypothetical protein N7466_006355 [Penicillium verhagenii]